MWDLLWSIRLSLGQEDSNQLALELFWPVYIKFSLQRIFHRLTVIRVHVGHLETVGAAEMQVFLMVSGSLSLSDG